MLAGGAAIARRGAANALNLLPLSGDFVAKVSGARLVRNNQTQEARRLNQSCSAWRFFESKLLHGAFKIVLQQYQSIADMAGLAAGSTRSHFDRCC